jgi:hypothetical protein
MTGEQIKAIAKENGMVEEYWMTNPPKFGACWMTPEGLVKTVRACLALAGSPAQLAERVGFEPTSRENP